MFGAAEAERGAEAEIEVAGALQRIDQLFSVELRSGRLMAGSARSPPHSPRASRNPAPRREIFGKCILVFEHDRRIARHRRDHLGHDHAVGVARPNSFSSSASAVEPTNDTLV